MKKIRMKIAAVIAALIGSMCFAGCCSHSYEEVGYVEPTCQYTGIKRYRCSICGEEKVERIPKLSDHEYADFITEATCYKAGSKVYKCRFCGKINDVTPLYKEHTYVNGVCSECGGHETGSEGLKYSITGNVATVIAYTGTAQDVIIPASINGVNVAMILDSVFAGNSYMKTVEIPATITYIGLNAFSSCPNLEKVIGAESVVEIGDGAFANCTSLTAYPFGEDLATIESYAFKNTALTKITFTSKEVMVDSSAFYSCKELTTLKADGCGLYIGENAFFGCGKLKTASIGAKSFYIGSGAFNGCESLTSISGLEFIAYIGDNAFAGCSSLKEAALGNRLNYIGRKAFYNCASLKSVTMQEYDFSTLYYYLEGVYTDSLTYISAEEGVWVYKSISGATEYISDISDSSLNAARLSGDYSYGVWVLPMTKAQREEKEKKDKEKAEEAASEE